MTWIVWLTWSDGHHSSSVPVATFPDWAQSWAAAYATQLQNWCAGSEWSASYSPLGSGPGFLGGMYP